jgi:hypothetical protein
VRGTSFLLCGALGPNDWDRMTGAWSALTCTRVVAGRKLLEQVLKECDKHPECTAVYLHVQALAVPPKISRVVVGAGARSDPLHALAQVGNDAAIEFYKTFGFEVGEVVKDYYQKLDVTDAVLLTKRPPFS